MSDCPLTRVFATHDGKWVWPVWPESKPAIIMTEKGIEVDQQLALPMSTLRQSFYVAVYTGGIYDIYSPSRKKLGTCIHSPSILAQTCRKHCRNNNKSIDILIVPMGMI